MTRQRGKNPKIPAFYPFIESEETDATSFSMTLPPRRGARPPKAHGCNGSRSTSTHPV